MCAELNGPRIDTGQRISEVSATPRDSTAESAVEGEGEGEGEGEDEDEDELEDAMLDRLAGAFPRWQSVPTFHMLTDACRV